MPLNLISNFAANVAQRNLGMSDASATNSLAKLSAGTRVLTAKDDAASLAVGSRLSAEIVGLKQASVNAGQAISMLQIADGAMAKVNDVLTRMKSLAVQSGSGQLSAVERGMLDTEFQALVSEVDRIANDTEFAGTKLVDGTIDVALTNATAFDPGDDGVQDISFRGSFEASDAVITYDAGNNAFTVAAYNEGDTATTNYTGTIDQTVSDGSTLSSGTAVTLSASGSNNQIDILLTDLFDADAAHAQGTLGITGSSATSFTFKVGTGISTVADEIAVTVDSISAGTLGLDTLDVTSDTAANTASSAISSAIDTLQTSRAKIGANQNRLEFAAANIATTTENTEAARSQLMDLDVAAEMSSFVSKQILVQAGVSMLAQANQMPNNLLRLFQ
jgi:flagellin